MSAAHDRRLRLDRLESLAALAGGITHEMGNLAASVTLSAQLLETCCSEPADRQVLASLDELARRLLHAGRQLHWLARGVAGEPTVFQPQYLLSDLQKLARVAFPASITVITRYPADLWPLAGDPLVAYQLLLALCREARDHLPAGGTLLLAARNEERDDPRLRAPGRPVPGDAPPGRCVVLEAIAEAAAATGEQQLAGDAGNAGNAGHASGSSGTGGRQAGLAARRRRRAAGDAMRSAAAAGGFTEPLPRDASGRGRRACLPAAVLDPEPDQLSRPARKA